MNSAPDQQWGADRLHGLAPACVHDITPEPLNIAKMGR